MAALLSDGGDVAETEREVDDLSLAWVDGMDDKYVQHGEYLSRSPNGGYDNFPPMNY